VSFLSKISAKVAQSDVNLFPSLKAIKMTNKIIFLSAAVILFSFSCLAQHTIVMKSGEKVNGVIASLKDGYINYTYKNNPKTVSIKEVSAIYFDDQSAGQSAIPASTTPATTTTAGGPREKGEKSVTYQGFNIRYKVADRTILKPPVVTNLTEQKGTVVVSVTVDKYGHVVKAVPGSEGSTTNSEYLYTKAKQAAESAQFDSNPTSPLEAKGYMVIQF
jgi:hypothetical protein